MNKFQKFKNLHYQDTALLLANVWDAGTAILIEELGFEAIATSSSAIANAHGYEDGENIDLDYLLIEVDRVVQCTNLPVTVDFEGGYARDAKTIAANIARLSKLGVVGINIEDSKGSNDRSILPGEEFGEILDQVKKDLQSQNIDMFINVRTDPFLLGLDNALEETINRIRIYEDCGADGIFTPFISSGRDILAVIESTKLPVNVLSGPGLPNIEELKGLGVKRISMGGALYASTYNALKETILQIRSSGSFQLLF